MCKHKPFSNISRQCKNLEVYLFRYCQDTGPQEPGGYNDRAWVSVGILKMENVLFLSKNEEAIKIMMEDGDDKPTSIESKVHRRTAM